MTQASNHTGVAIIKAIRLLCSDLGGCWVWRGCMRGLQPEMRDPITKQARPVRHIAWEAHFQNAAPHGLACRFGTRGCVNPKHLAPLAHSDAIKQGLQLSPNGKAVQRKKNQQYQRRFSAEQVAHIQAQSMTQSEYAVLYGCHKSTISRVQNHITHALPNPFSPLIQLGISHAKNHR